MAADDFFRRWAKHNAERRSPPARSVPAPAGKIADALPTLEDVAALTPESDYSRFVVRGIDPTAQRSAMKKLFADPHFSLMDGLDTYIGDYNKFEPIPPEMLALLNHAKDLLDPLARLEPRPIGEPPVQLAPSGQNVEEESGEDSASLRRGNAAQANSAPVNSGPVNSGPVNSPPAMPAAVAPMHLANPGEA